MSSIPYIIKSFRGGISDENDKGIAGSFKYGHGIDIHAQDDLLTARQAMETVFDASTTTQTGIIKHFVNAHDGTTYAFGSTGSIFAISGDGDWNFVYNDENGEIKGASEWAVTSDSGITDTWYLFWATNTSVARKELGGVDVAPDSGTARWTDATQDWKTTLDPVDSHFMTHASGELMIANNNAVATVDYSDNYTALDLNVRPGNIIKTLEERDDYAIIGSGRKDNSEEGHIWSWITTAQNWVQKKRIPAKGVNAINNAELMILQAGSDGELFFSDFVNATPLHGIPGGGEVAPAGVAIEDDLAAFGFYGGSYPGVWTYGRKRKNRPYALNYAYRLAKTVAGSTISTISAMTMIDGVLHVSWGTTDESTSDYGVDAVDANNKADVTYEGLEFDAGQPHLSKKFETVKVIMEPLPSGTSLAIRWKKNRQVTGGDSSAGAGWKYAVTGNGATTFAEANATEAIFIIGDAMETIEVACDATASSNESPRVNAIITYIDQQSYNFG